MQTAAQQVDWRCPCRRYLARCRVRLQIQPIGVRRLPRNDPESAHESGTKIRNNISIEILKEEYVEWVRIFSQSHSDLIKRQGLLFNEGIILPNRKNASTKALSVRGTRFVYGTQKSFYVLITGMLEGPLGDSCTCLCAGHLECCNGIWRDIVFDTRV